MLVVQDGEIPQLVADTQIEPLAAVHHPVAETYADHRIRQAPVPVGMDGQAAKQGLVGCEEFGQGVEKERLAKAPRPREEIVLAVLDQLAGKAALVHVVIAFLADLAEVLDTNGQFRHGRGSGSGTGTGTGGVRLNFVYPGPPGLSRAFAWKQSAGGAREDSRSRVQAGMG
jgi:hypothetical protein